MSARMRNIIEAAQKLLKEQELSERDKAAMTVAKKLVQSALTEAKALKQFSLKEQQEIAAEALDLAGSNPEFYESETE